MNDFTTVYPEATVLDSNKRVNYVHGLVLGVDEFRQEEHYLLEKDRLHNRNLHGSGTVCGLSVTQEETAAGIEVQVSPGIAICANGQVVEVPRDQCALINEWLAGNADAVLEQLGSPAATNLSLYLVLRYRDCETDYVPVPTGPCHSLEDSTAPSRLADDFSLSFELVPPGSVVIGGSPAQGIADDPVQDFIQLLATIPVQAGGGLTVDGIRALVRSLLEGSPAELSVPGSPPLGDAMDPANVPELVHAALLTWVTEVKPCLMSACACIGTLPGNPYANCVFLAEVSMEVALLDGVPQLLPGSSLEISEQARQCLLDTHALQSLQSTLLSTVLGAAPGQAAAPVLKRIVLPAHMALGRGPTSIGTLNNNIPSMRLASGGVPRVLFMLPIPDDMDIGMGLQFRLVWGWEANSDVSFDWSVGAQYYAGGDPVSPFETVEFSVAEAAAGQNTVHITEFSNFDAALILDDSIEFAVLEISRADTGGPLPQVHLLQVDIEYTANAAGGIAQS